MLTGETKQIGTVKLVETKVKMPCMDWTEVSKTWG